MTKRKRHGKITKEGLFLFYDIGGVPVFQKGIPLEKRVKILHNDFVPRKILDIDEFLPDYVRDWAKDKELDYSIWLDHFSNKQFGYYVCDDPYSIKLIAHKGVSKFVGMVTFRFEEDGSIFTKQCQGKSDSREELKYIKWDKMLFHILWCYASQNGLPRIEIQKAEHNVYYKREWIYHGEGKEHFRERLMKRYTLLPEEMGFEGSSKSITLVKETAPNNTKGYKRIIRAVNQPFIRKF